jgi:hypothetical protein
VRSRVRPHHLNLLLLMLIAVGVIFVATLSQISSTDGTAGQLTGSDWSTSGLIQGLSCPTVRTCVAIGANLDSPVDGGQDVSYERNGVWRTKATIPKGVAGSVPTLGSVSCSSAGNCLAEESYVQNVGELVGVIEQDGRWLPPRILGSVAKGSQEFYGFLGSSCSHEGICWALATSTPGPKPFEDATYAFGEKDGHWLSPIRIAANLQQRSKSRTFFLGISCWSRSACTVSGLFSYGQNKKYLYFVQSETNGRWAPAQTVPETDNSALGLFNDKDFACDSMGNCLFGGFSQSNSGNGLGAAFRGVGVVYQEVDGRWLSPTDGLGMGRGVKSSVVEGVSCPSTHLCIAAGESNFGGANNYLFVQTDRNNHWQKPVHLPVIVNFGYFFGTISCVNQTECYVVGTNDVSENISNDFIEGLVHSHWTRIRFLQLGGDGFHDTGIIGLSCSVGGCWAYGYINNASSSGLWATYYFARFSS